MSGTPDRTAGGTSRALQGCLIGAVVLFVVMFVGMLYLGYIQFQNNTAPREGAETTTAPLSMIAPLPDV